MQLKHFFIISVTCMTAALVGVLWYYSSLTNEIITSQTPDGRTFTQDIGNEIDKNDLIRISSPRPNTEVSRPLVISGEARGQWFFEASFPIHLQDASGNNIATTVAQAEGEWMTTEFVPFQATLTIPDAFSGQAVLVLEKDNPSGLPEHGDLLRVPITVR